MPQAVLLCPLNITPRCGCSLTCREPPISVSPILLIQIFQPGTEEPATKQYSVSDFTKTGDGKVNVVATEASSLVVISDGFLTTRPKGKTFGPGYPLTVFRISNQQGITSSFAKKYKSIEVIKYPSVSFTIFPAAFVFF